MKRIFECANPEQCHKVPPGKKGAGVWQAPAKKGSEPDLTKVPASADVPAEKWKRGARTYKYAYEEGNAAIGKDKKVYACDPHEIKTNSKKKIQKVDKSMKDKDGKTQKYKTVLGCTKYAPGSK